MNDQEKRSELLNYLHEMQNSHPQQYLTEEVLNSAAQKYGLTKAEIYGVASYYSMFSLKPRGKYIIRICQSPVCQMMGSQSLTEFLENKLRLVAGETTSDGIFTLEHTECLGRCGKAPSMMVNKDVFTELTQEKLESLIEKLKTEAK
ncbi:MAG: NADH-quinone oxidoreductase subunit E [Bacteroidetes bacterium HGW-Bacteroidetes-6]|jgi:NADH-quinone oxidoreductase E subunit|nr:MAG: NADH-quinone oxidoreductase subunit E [Bacteroidetes bacterium HGW-Bacteroidetes-6]